MTVVFAHGRAKDIVNRHLPLWKNCTDKIIIVSPNDDPCILDNIDCLTYGKSEKWGTSLIERQLFAMRMSALYDADFYVFLEYDAFLLDKPILRPTIQGNLFNQHLFINKEYDSIEKGLCFMHFPWIWPANLLKEFITHTNHNKDTDSKYPDGWIVQKLIALDLKIHNLLFTEGYSMNTIDTEERILEAVDGIKNNGFYAIHGVKTDALLQRLLRTYKESRVSRDL